MKIVVIGDTRSHRLEDRHHSAPGRSRGCRRLAPKRYQQHHRWERFSTNRRTEPRHGSGKMLRELAR